MWPALVVTSPILKLSLWRPVLSVVTACSGWSTVRLLVSRDAKWRLRRARGCGILLLSRGLTYEDR